MKPFLMNLISCLIGVGVAIYLVTPTERSLEENANALQLSLSDYHSVLGQLEPENNTLKAAVARLTQDPFSAEENSELLKLRGLVNLLRKEAIELEGSLTALAGNGKADDGQEGAEAGLVFVDQFSGKTLKVAEHRDLRPTYQFVKAGNLEEARAMLDKYPEFLNLQVGGAASTMLHTAAYNKRPEMVEELLRRGASVNIQNRDGHTPLYDSVLGGTEQTTLLLLQAGANFSIPDNKGITPLKLAVDGGRKEFADLLRRWGAKE